MPRDRLSTARHPSDRNPVLRVDGPAELVNAVPYLIGFQPHHSLVLVGLDCGELVVTARLDVAPDVGGGAGELAGDIDHAVQIVTNAGVTTVIVLLFDVEPDGRSGRSALDRLVPTLYQHGLDIADVLAVRDERWRSLLCGDGQCCPPEGRPVGERTSAFAAAATVAGVVVHPDRGALAVVLEPDEDARSAIGPAVEAALADRVARSASGPPGRDHRAVRALFAAARAADESSADDGSVIAAEDHELAGLGAALTDIAVRDSVWLAIDDGRIDGRPLWALLARRLPGPHDAAPAFLYGWAAWRDGNGAVAAIAARRALTADPDYTAADLLLAAVEAGVDPRRVPKLRRPRGARSADGAGQATRTKT